MSGKYTLEYIKNVIGQSGNTREQPARQPGERYSLEYIQNVIAQQEQQSTSGGPLQRQNGGGGAQAAALDVKYTAPAAPTLTEQLFGPRLNAREQEKMRQAIQATRPTPAPAAQGISADVLLPYRQIGARGAAAKQAEENPLLKLFGPPARHEGRQTPAAQSGAPAVSATWRAAAGMDAQQAPAWQREAQQQRQNAAQGVPARQANAAMGTSAAPQQQESESQRRRREARQRALQLNKEALESGASTLDAKSALVELRMQQQQAAYGAQEQAARTERNPAGSLYAPGNTLLGTVQRSGEGLRGQELKNEAAKALAEMTGPEEYLAKDKLSELEKQAALLLLNRFREENPGKLDQYDALPEQERAEVDQWLALEYKLGSFTSAMDRLAKGARSLQYNLVGTPDVIGQTTKQAVKDTAANLQDPEWSALADQLVQIDRQMEIRRELGGEQDLELLELLARRAELKKQMDAAAQKTPMDLDTYGARTLLLGQDLTRQAQTGLSPAGKAAYNVGYSVADNLAVLPLNFIPGVGQAAALGVQGAKAGAQEMLELAQRGVGAEEALARGAIAGGIEAGTEKIGMDNLVDIVGKGGKQALNSMLKKQLAELAAKGGQSAGASAAAALLSNATAEGLEEAVGYIANNAAAQLFGDPESEFDLEEFLASVGQGAAAGLILGGGGMAANALLGGRAGAQTKKQAQIKTEPPTLMEQLFGPTAAPQQSKPREPSLVEQLLPPVAGQQSKPREPSLVEQLLPPVAGQQSKPREPSLIEQLLPPIPKQEAKKNATKPQAAVTAEARTAQELEAILAENLARQEQIKTRVRALIPDAKQIPTVQGLWKQMAQLMDQESEIRQQQEAVLQTNAKTAEAQAPAVDVENTVVNDDPAAHTAQEQQRIEEYKAAVDPRVAEFVEAVRTEPQNRWRKLELGQVDGQTAAKIRELTGVDVSGYTHTIQPSAVEHIDNGHGANGTSDHSMQNVEDIARIPWVLENYDTITRETMQNGKPFLSGEFKNRDGSRAQTVVFKKAINGTIYVVEAVPDSKARRLQLVTAYITENGQKNTGAYQEATVQSTISHTPEAELELTPVTSSIPTEGRDVNTPDGRDPYDLASLYRSDPKRAGMDEAAQARAQRRLQNTPITEEERHARLQGTTGDTVKDTFALHPITEPVNFGMDAESIRAAEQEIRQLKRELGRAERNPYRPGGDATKVEMADAEQVAQGEKSMQQLSAGSRPDVVAELAHLQARLNEAKQYGLSYQKRSIFEHQQTLLRAALDGINDPEALVGKEINIAELNRRTPERAFRRVFGEQKGVELAELVIKPVHQNESAKVQFINKLFDQARALDLNEVERKLVQLVGEKAAGKGGRPITIGDIQSRGLTDEMMPGGMDIKERRFILQNLAKADPAKVEKAVGWYKQIYKSLWEVVNDFRLEHGMAEIGWQEDYFPHFNEDDPLTKTLKQLGIEGASGLPTSIAGQTAWFRPNSRYVPFFQQRKGIATSYDSDLGFQSYLTAVADMLYHTDDIMRLRNLDSVLRGKRTELDVGNVVDSILGKKNLELNAQEAELIEKVLTGEYMDIEAAKNYNTFAQWLTNYTNKLANKQLFGDRAIEERYGRLIFNVAGKIESAFARNSTVGNLSTALNNTITLPKVLATTPQKYVAQAVKGLVSGEFKTSGLAQESEFLLGKRGVRPLVESRTRRVARMISNVTFEPVEVAVSDIAFYAKYLHGLGIGATRSEAIETANDYAAYMMARRSKGARPLGMETKDPFHKLFTLFQTEVSNDYYSFRDDLPAYLKRIEAESGKEAAHKQLAMGAAKYCVYSAALNVLLENITGYAPAPDPLRWLWEFVEALFDRDEEEEDNLAKGVQRVGGAVGGLASNLLNQVPGASTAMALAGVGDGRVPLPEFNLKKAEQGALALFEDEEESPNKYGYAAKNLWDGLVKPGMMTALPFGGNQLRKTLEGTKVMGHGAMYSESKDGQKLQTEVQNNPLTLQGASNWLKAAAFGKSAIREVGDYYDNGGKPKSVSYTEAYKEGYSTNILDQLFPGGGKGAGKVTYEQLTGGAKDAVKVDNWLTDLLRYQDNKNVLPSNSTTSVTVDGETVKLTGSKALEFAQTKAETSYNILETLLPTANHYDLGVQEKYAVRAQDYAHAVAKEEVLGVEPAEGSWIEKVQTYSGAEGAKLNDRLLNALLGSSIVAETKADHYPNGRPIEGSRKRKAIAALKEAGFDTKTALQMWEVFN